MVVERLTDGVRITFSTPASPYLFCGMVLLVVVVGLFICFSALLVRDGWNFSDLQVFAAVVMAGLFCTGCFAAASVFIRERAVVIARTETLTIFRVGYLLRRRWEWHRSQIRGITDWHGLRVVTDQRAATFFPRQRRNELFWLKDMLVRIMELPATPPPVAEELSVEILGPRPLAPGRGYLLVSPGSLILRYEWCEQPNFEFFNLAYFSLKHLCRMCLWGIRPLSHADIICKIDEYNSALVQVNSAYPAALVQFRCADKEALESALARFWGGADE